MNNKLDLKDIHTLTIAPKNGISLTLNEGLEDEAKVSLEGKDICLRICLNSKYDNKLKEIK